MSLELSGYLSVHNIIGPTALDCSDMKDDVLNHWIKEQSSAPISCPCTLCLYLCGNDMEQRLKGLKADLLSANAGA